MLTIVTTTSPIKTNPSTDLIEKSIQSLYNVKAFIDCKKIIVFDNVEEEDLSFYPNYNKTLSEIKQDYGEFKKNIENLVKNSPYFKDTKLLFLDSRKGQAWALEEAFKLVDTKYVFLHQHDFVFLEDFDVNGIMKTMDENTSIKVVRACNGENRPNYFDGPVDSKVNGVSYVPLVRSFRFSDNEHLTTVDYYKEHIFPLVTYKCFAEHFVMSPDFVQKRNEIEKNHDVWGIYIYGKMGQKTNLKHLDGRNF